MTRRAEFPHLLLYDHLLLFESAAGKSRSARGRSDATCTNQNWTMDFIHDQWAMGCKIRTLTVADTLSRFSPTLDPCFSYGGEDVVATLERICWRVGYPRTIRVDQGSQLISRDLDL